MNRAAYALLTDWPLLVSETLLFGLAFFRLAMAPEAKATGARWRDSIQVIRILALFAVLDAPLVFFHDVAALAQVPFRSAPQLVPTFVAQTHAGRIWMVRFAAFPALAVVASPRKVGRSRLASICGLSAILLLARGLLSHAIDKGPAAVAAYAIHAIAAAIWIGVLCGLWLDASEAGQRNAAATRALRVSRMAGYCVGALVASGIYTAYFELGLSIDRLFYSSYGRTLIGKVACAGLVFATGAYNRYFLLPHLDDDRARSALVRNVAFECLLLLAVLEWSAVLAGTPPPH